MWPGRVTHHSLTSVVIYLVLLSSARARWLGQAWGGAIKPIGINTIINNECVKRSTVHGYTSHQGHGSGQDTALARMLGQVAGPVTSRAVLALLRTHRGHGPISSCSQSELNRMEASLERCVSKVQYQMRCSASSPQEQCLWLDLFLENCTDGILGLCFDRSSLEYIREQQERYLKRSKAVRRSCRGLPGEGGKRWPGEGGDFRDKLREKVLRHPLKVSYSDYLQSVLSQL